MATEKDTKLQTALATLKAGGTVPMNKNSSARMINGKIVVYNPKITSPSEFSAGNSKLAEQKLAAAQKAGKATVVSQQDFARGLNPTIPTPPKSTPKTAPAPKKKLKGKADDDKGKKKKPAAKVRKEADPELAPGKRLKNPLGALSSYTYQLSLYMITPDALDMFIDSGGKDINRLGVQSVNALGPNISNSQVTAGAYIVAQSGGVNLAEEQRAPSFGFDYGIDNLSFEIIGPKENGSAAAQIDFKFQITEPLGFSFISNLKRAADAIKDYTNKVRKLQASKKKENAANNRQNNKKKNGRQDANNSAQGGALSGNATKTGSGNPENPTKNFFILGIRFYGYNASGKLVRGTDTTASTNIYGAVIGEQEIDPGNSGYALFERFYPISINEMKTTVDGRATVYNIKAQSYNLNALGTKRGIVNNDTKITATTVGEAFDKLMARLNKEQKKLNVSSDGYTYDIKYASSYDADRIRNSRIVSKADLDKYKWPGSGAKNTKESNSGTETNKGNKPKNNARDITINRGTPILQAINQIIAQSSFLEDALKTVFTTALEPDQEKEDLPALDNSGKKTIEWYHCTPDLKSPVWDDEKADWMYDIDYVLNVYDTPVLDTAYTNPGKKYYGPHKRYEYWYTGTNTEVIKYQQVLNNNYYTTFLGDSFGADDKKKKADKQGGTNTPNASNGSGNEAGVTTSKVENQKSGQPRQGKQGNAMEAQNSYMTSLFDPSATATAKVEILGDPDWMMSITPPRGKKSKSDTSPIVNPVVRGSNESTVYSKFYGNDGYTANPGSGQVFFEIDFKEAVDYKSDGRNIATKDGSGVSGAPGTLSINNSILFWKDPKSVSKLVKGISYQMTKCTCNFSNGSFKQVLEGVINTFGDSGSNDDGKAREQRSSNRASNSGANRGSNTATTTKKGMKPSDLEAWKRYSNDPKVRDAAWKKKQQQDAATTQRLNAAVPPLLRAKNKPET